VQCLGRRLDVDPGIRRQLQLELVPTAEHVGAEHPPQLGQQCRERRLGSSGRGVRPQHVEQG